MAKDGYILSIDQGTTSSRSLIFTDNGQILSQKNFEFNQFYPKNGWVEHDPIEILETTLKAVKFVISDSKIDPKDISVAGITNQRETVVAWDKTSGKPIYNAIVWQDRRTEELCNKLRSDGFSEIISKKTGLIIDPYFSGTKIKWIIDNIPDAKRNIDKGNLIVGTIDAWLIWNLSKGTSHSTDVTNASRTMLYNIKEDKWDNDLLKILNIDLSLLPNVRNSSDDFGTIDKSFFGSPIPIGGVAGDQQSASIGQLCFKEGMIKSTYGTGCFVLMNTGKTKMESKSNLLSTTAFKINSNKSYALEGSIFNAGTVVQWMRDELNFVSSASEIESLSSQSKNEVYFVPAFTGLGAPYWNSEVRGQLSGITRDTSKADIALAALKSICFQTRDLFECFQIDANRSISDFIVRVDGGMSKNNLMMQFLADILGTKVERPVNQESTATGAAYLAGMHAGIYKGIADLEDLWKTDRIFEPSMPDEKSEAEYSGWKNTINKLIKNG